MKAGKAKLKNAGAWRQAGLIWLLLIFCLISIEETAVSQPPVPPLKGEGTNACRKDPSIIFTEEQARKLADLRREHLLELKPLISALMDLRIDLRLAIRYPQTPPQELLEKQKRISALQAKIQDLSFSYQIKMRSIFTKEQLDRFPPDCPLKYHSGFGIRRRLN